MCGNPFRFALLLPAGPGASWERGEAKAGRDEAGEMRACSACAGDYEDPDRTACPPDDGDDGEEEQTLWPSEEEFSAE
jgi:hypothetical protein